LNHCWFDEESATNRGQEVKLRRAFLNERSLGLNSQTVNPDSRGPQEQAQQRQEYQAEAM
jgi:hypothetical protein